MTEDRLERWERAVQSYFAARREIDRLEALPEAVDPNLRRMAVASERLADSMAGLLDASPPHLAGFGFKLAVVPHMVELDRFADRARKSALDERAPALVGGLRRAINRG